MTHPPHPDAADAPPGTGEPVAGQPPGAAGEVGGVGRAVAHNTGLNLLAALAPVAVAVVTIPVVIRGYGLERFGILALAQVLLGYFGMFDLGLGRATTRFVSAALGQNDEETAANTLWTSLPLSAALGLVGSLILAAVAPVLVGHVLKVPAGLARECQLALYGIAGMIPFAVITSGLMGFLEAQQRFDLANLLQVPASIGSQFLPVAVLPFSRNIGVVVLGLVVVRAVLAFATFRTCLRTLPALRRRRRPDRATMRRLLTFGGWLTVSNIVGPLMVNLDRFAIGAVMSLKAVAYYTTPYDVISRVLIVPSSLLRAVYPVFGSTSPERVPELRDLLRQSSKLLALALTLVLVPVVALATDLLRLWLGQQFALQAASVLKILCVGVLINAVAFVPYGLIQGVGRPDLTAKLHLTELVIYVPLLWLLLHLFGIVGAAIAWTLRATLDASLLFIFALSMVHSGRSTVGNRLIRRTGLLIGVTVALAWGLGSLHTGVTARILLTLLLEASLVLLVWRQALDDSERGDVRRAAVALTLRPRSRL